MVKLISVVFVKQIVKMMSIVSIEFVLPVSDPTVHAVVSVLPVPDPTVGTVEAHAYAAVEALC